MGKTLSDYAHKDSKVIGYLELLEKRLKPSRFKHTCGVVTTAYKMAKHYGSDPHQAMVAAALHDYAKNMSAEDLIAYADQKALKTDWVMRTSGELLHGLVGAKMVSEELDIQDEATLNAIRYHTVGRRDMSLTEKIVYLADAIEPGRSEYPGLEALRDLAFEDLDMAILVSVTGTLSYVLERGLPIHPNSLELYNSLVTKYGKVILVK